MSSGYHQFHHQNASLGYQKAGKGPEPLLLFHGFGQDHSAFSTLVDALGDKFTFFSFDLFFHGQSQWLQGETPLSKDQWRVIVAAFLLQQKIQRFSLAGFSLGAKFALAILELFPTMVNSIYLLAPDGINTNVWYSLATYPVVLRTWFRSMIYKPGRFLSVVKVAKAMRWVDPGVLRFAQNQMDTEKQRKRVYYSWVVFRTLKFDIHDIAQVINANNVYLFIAVGKFDKIITAKNMRRLTIHVPKARLEILQTGHNGVIAECVKVLRNMESKKP